jgi:hypothetical protein
LTRRGESAKEQFLGEAMTKFWVAAFLFGTALAQQEERAIVPQFADGGGWKSRLVLVNRSVTLSARALLNFYGQSGQPLAFSVLGAGVVSTVERTLAPGGSVLLETAGVQSSVQAGWIEIRSGSSAEPGGYDPGSNTIVPTTPATSPVLAFVTFRQRIEGRPTDFEASVASLPGETRSVAFALDNMENYVTSVAVANTQSTPTDVTVTFRGPGGVVFHREQINLAGRGHAFFETTNRFQASRNLRGTVEFSTTTSRLAALCLWFNPTGPFSSVPSMTLSQ